MKKPRLCEILGVVVQLHIVVITNPEKEKSSSTAIEEEFCKK